MKRLFILSLVAVLTMLGCATGKNTPVRSPSALHQHIGESTVALVAISEDGDVHVYCTGIWIGKDEILTAGHCVAREEGADPVDRKIYYVVQKEVHEVGEDPAALHLAKVTAFDEDHDLALIKADKRGVPGLHEVASLAEEMPGIGEHIFVVGHPRGAYWSYTEGTVAAYREESVIGKVVQFNGTVWYGNSGGGVFDDSGNLLGVCSRLTRIPNMSLFVHLDSVKKFVKDAHTPSDIKE